MKHSFLKQFALGSIALFSVGAASASTDHTIVPGSRIGIVKIGASENNSLKALGKADSRDAALGHYWAFWYSHTRAMPGTLRHELDVYSTATGGIQQIRVTSPWFRTAEGITAGSSLRQIHRRFRAAHPIAYYNSPALGGRVYIYDDVKQGIGFEIWRGKHGGGVDGRCLAIWVHRTGDKADAIYMPLFQPKQI